MDRRGFIATLTVGLLAGPRPADAQPGGMSVIGYLSARSPEDTTHLVAAFRRGLGENGFVEGRNVAIEYRWARGQQDRLPALAADLVRRPLAVLVSTGGDAAAQAARAATSTTPIVFTMGTDPVKAGLVASYNRPGGNATGISILTSTLEAKRLELLHEALPQVVAVGFLLDPKYPAAETQLKDAQEATHGLGLRIQVLLANTDREIDAAFETVARQRLKALAVASNPFFDTRREKLVTLAVRHGVPAI